METQEFFSASLAALKESMARHAVSIEAKLYDELFECWSDDAGRQASEADALRQTPDSTLTYGEVMYAPFAAAIMDRVRAHGGLHEGCRVFTDIGAVSGREKQRGRR